jgi:TRAP-type C4-dicarboxylate transport system substrate-binding protein
LKAAFITAAVFFGVQSAFGGFGACGAAEAAAQYKWRFSIPWTRPQLHEALVDFARRVSEYSDGRIEIEVFPDGLLGSHDESFKNVQAGDTEMAMLVPYVNLVPGGAVNFMPWAVSSYAGFEIAFDPEKGMLHKVVDRAYQEVNMKVLFTVTSGGYGLANNVREIKSPADLKNLKVRVSASESGVQMLGNLGKGTGMTMETIPWSELYNALSRKVVDGCWGTIGLIVAERQYEVLKYYSDIGFMWDAAQVLINKDLWDGLPDDLKAVLGKASVESMAYALKGQMDMEDSYIEEMKKNGLVPYVPTPEEKDVFLKGSNVEEIWDNLVKPWVEKAFPGENMSQELLTELERIRKSVEGKR